MKKILVTAGNGQLGNCLRKISEYYKNQYHFVFKDSQELNITNFDRVMEVFENEKPDFCINTAAFTAVDLAESKEEECYQVNADGAENLAIACEKFSTKLIHISTDYVFDGDTQISYSEDNFKNPLGVYGKSKLLGENKIIEILPNAVIIRTSWLYSEFNKNFVKTMLSLFETKDELNVVSDQFGQPTNANDLANAIMLIVEQNLKSPGVFHFSNYPETNWYEFAKKIAEFSKSGIKINPIKTENYPTPAQRPMRSTMSLNKIEKIYKVPIEHWENSLEECISNLKN